MKLLIAGSRSLKNIEIDFMVESINEYLSDIGMLDVKEIVSGGAIGIDTLGETIAKDFGLKVKQFLPDWKTLGKKAGAVRNKEMVDYCDAAIIFYDGQSKGTQITIDLLKRSKKSYKVILIE